MFNYKNIGIWCILLTLLESTKQFVSLEEDKLKTLRIPYDSENVVNKGEKQHFPCYKHYIDDYRKVQEYAPFKHEEEEMQEYDDYRDEKDLPNLSKGGLSLFSWWKNEPELKKPKSGTNSPVANEVINTDASTTVDPNETSTAVDDNAATSAETTAGADVTATTDTAGSINNNVSTDATISASNTLDPSALSSGTTTSSTISTMSSTPTPKASTFLTTCVCYNVTEECIPVFIPTPDACLGDAMNTASTSSTGGDTVASTSSGTVSTTTSSTDNTSATTTVSLSTTVSAALSDSTTSQNTGGSLVVSDTAADLNAKSTSLTANGPDTTLSPGDSTSVTNTNAGNSAATILNMYGAGMILPVYEFPMTPFVATTIQPPTTKKKRTFHKLNSQLTNNIFSNNYKQMLHKNPINKSNKTINGMPLSSMDSNKVHPSFLYNQSKTINNIMVVNRITSPSNTTPSEQFDLRNNSFSLDKMAVQNQENGMSKIEPNRTILQPLEKHSDNHSIFDQKLISSSNQSGELMQSQTTREILYTPSNKSQNELISYNQSNSQISIPAETIKSLPNTVQENYNLSKNITQATENQIPVIENFNSNFVKYNDTYLSQNSNTSTNLIDLCKNVTCQGNNYFSECCSRASGPEKHQEEFSYFQPIPGYFNTTVKTTIKQFEPILNLQYNNIAPVPSDALHLTVAKNASLFTAKIETSTAKCSCGSKPKNNRVVRENDMSDFVKFQLMHGMTAPDGKEMMNALKEANLEFQKVNREFHSNEPTGNIYQMNGSGKNIRLPVIDNHMLSKKEPEGVVPPLSSNKILDDLRATISNSLLQSNLKSSPFQRDRYRFIRNQGLKDQMETIRENNMILEKIKKETEMELQRLCLLENKRREEELLFDKKRENELKELKTIQDLIHREFESRTLGDSAKRAITETPSNHITQIGPTRKGGVYSKPVNNIDKSGVNDEFNNFIFDRYSSLSSNTSKNLNPSSNFVDLDKFPELEINNSVNVPHDDALLLFNIGSDKEFLSEKQRKRREGFNNPYNNMLKEYITSVQSPENNTG